MKTPLAKYSSLIAIVAVTILGTLPQWTTARADPAMSPLTHWESDGSNVRIMRHQDGSKTIFRRSTNDRKLIKKTFSPNGAIRLVTVYDRAKTTYPDNQPFKKEATQSSKR